ncbi:hypothetical protein [Corynebacterium rouxii]|uniref:Uncharacterized protein n=1 Tax=Corynebacterium rouxii TaxID=2719119 RepID=A0A6I8MCP5_9CORY|nr:hypothetical protein [Corynebacterium rouxii]MDT9407740.1 hypothetical protein [Corynebacterium rouxii]MDT9409921.1 hypothetical protein [Corynebacterium rouxii]VZH83990.1 hypothetical protein FRC0190_00038 [Corynebacterium rouxii]
MDKYYFDSPIAPISYGVTFVPFSLEDTVECFIQWAEDDEGKPFDESLRDLGGTKAEISQVSAKREDLPNLLKPQNSICRYVLVPTKSRWTAIFSPHSIHRLGGFTKTDIPIQTLGIWAARQLELPEHAPYSVTVTAEPRRTAKQTSGKFQSRCGTCGVIIRSTGDFEEALEYGHELSRVMNGGIDSFEVRSWTMAPLSSFGVTDAPEIDVDFKLKTDMSSQEIDRMWEIFNFDDVDHICQQLGIDVFDDAFYGTSGYLIELWGKKHQYYPIEDRIPFAKYQEYCGLTSDVIRAWSSQPPTI